MDKTEKNMDQTAQRQAAKKKGQAVKKGEQDLTMEEAFARLNVILDRMEGGELPLEETFGLYKEGLELVMVCEGKIDRIEKELKVLEENGVIHEEQE